MLRDAFYRVGSELFPQGEGFLPESRDVMLVSYPKSGNTWVRALVANLVGVRHSLQEMDRLVPDVYTCRGHVLRSAFRFPCSGRLIKSHESFKASYKRVIHVVRDPRDVCVSYYHYLGGIQRAFDPETTSLGSFVDMYFSGSIDGYGTWGEHTTSWLGAESADLLLLRYEDLLADAPRSLAQICEFLGLDEDASALQTAVDNCSLERLQAKEASEKSRWHPVNKVAGEAKFFRRGGRASRKELDKVSQERICTKWRDQMEELGYLV